WPYMESAAGTTIEGVISATRKGMGFFSLPDSEEDAFIPTESMGHALHGDVVKVTIVGESTDPKTGKRRPLGKVVEVVSRARETFVGTLVEEGSTTMLHPDYKKMYVPIEVRSRAGAPTGFKVLVRLKGWEEGAAYPWGEVEEVIGPTGEHETEMRALALGQGF